VPRWRPTARSGPRVRLTGKDVKIPAWLGQVRGQNLFHSFERFGVPTKGWVTFTGPDGLKKVRLAEAGEIPLQHPKW
jgi:hypothetical protein